MGQEELCVRKVTNTLKKTHGGWRDVRPDSVSLSCFLLDKKVEQLLCCGRERSLMQGVGLSLEQGQCLVTEREPSPQASLLLVVGGKVQSVGFLLCSQRTGSRLLAERVREGGVGGLRGDL